MTTPDVTTLPKRLHILDDEEIEALYGRPCFTGDERTDVFTLTQPEKDLLASFTQIPLQLHFLLQLGYFKVKQLFFTFTFDDVAEDVTYLLERYFPAKPRPELRMPNKRTILKQRHQILKLFGYRLCTPTDRQDLFLRAQLAARISSKPVYVLRELLHYLTEHRLVKPGYTFLQEELVGKALAAEVQRLATMLHALLSSEACVELDALLTSTDEHYTITWLKRQPKDFSFGEMRREMARGEHLVHLYTLSKQIVPNLEISREAITYYASLVSYYSVFRLKQLDTWTIYLYLLCFVFHRYQRFNDNLLTCFLHLVKQYADEAKATAKRAVSDYRGTSDHDLPKAGEVLKLFITEDEGNTLFGTMQEKAFALLDRQRLTHVAEYLVNEASCDELAFEWEHIDAMAWRFKHHLRPLFRAVDLSATRVNAPILEAVHFLKTAFQQDRPLRQINSGDFPADFVPAREKRYLFQRTETNEKHLIPDRYEFLVYRLVRHRLEAGDLFCRDSVRFRSFEEDLVDDQQWANKEALLAQTGVALLTRPIQDHLAELKCQLEERLRRVNQRICAGENSHVHLTTTGKHKRWTLQYPTSTEPINHPIFETVPQVSISRVLHFVNHHCHFMTCFEHILGRYSKHTADERVLSACLVAWATNMGLGRMGDISDIPFTILASTSDNFLRLETLKAANACISNAIAALTMFRHYDIANVIHSSSDGQKFETTLPTFNARHSPKYFGLAKGIVAYTLVANHVPVNAELIGAHDHESHFVFDLLFNNTTDIHPQVHSTDTHGTGPRQFCVAAHLRVSVRPAL